MFDFLVSSALDMTPTFGRLLTILLSKLAKNFLIFLGRDSIYSNLLYNLFYYCMYIVVLIGLSFMRRLQLFFTFLFFETTYLKVLLSKGVTMTHLANFSLYSTQKLRGPSQVSIWTWLEKLVSYNNQCISLINTM